MPLRLKPLRQQVVVITGATSGIGLATALKAAEGGAAVVMAARNEVALQEICQTIRDRGGRAAYAKADMADPTQVERIAQTAVEAFGGFDTWVNNAGAGIYGELVEMPIEEHRRLFETNYWGVVNGSTVAADHFKDRPQGGALINVGSVNSDFAIPLLGAYSASKHAVKGYTDALRIELRNAGAPVSVTLIKPSGIGTPFPQHARNHLSSEPAVAPPIYSPDVVARAILHAAQHRVRDVTVGGAGRIMARAAGYAPSLMDRVLGWAMPLVQQTGRPSTQSDNLFDHAEDGNIYSPAGAGLPVSLYNLVLRHPVASLAAATIGGAVVARVFRARH